MAKGGGQEKYHKLSRIQDCHSVQQKQLPASGKEFLQDRLMYMHLVFRLIESDTAA